MCSALSSKKRGPSHSHRRGKSITTTRNSSGSVVGVLSGTGSGSGTSGGGVVAGAGSSSTGAGAGGAGAAGQAGASGGPGKRKSVGAAVGPIGASAMDDSVDYRHEVARYIRTLVGALHEMDKAASSLNELANGADAAHKRLIDSEFAHHLSEFNHSSFVATLSVRHRECVDQPEVVERSATILKQVLESKKNDFVCFSFENHPKHFLL